MNTTSVRSTRTLGRAAKRAASVRVCSASSPVNRPSSLRIKVSAESHISKRSIPPPQYVSSRKDHRPCPFQRAFPYERSPHEIAGLVPEVGRRKLFNQQTLWNALSWNLPSGGQSPDAGTAQPIHKARRPSWP